MRDSSVTAQRSEPTAMHLHLLCNRSKPRDRASAASHVWFHPHGAAFHGIVIPVPRFPRDASCKRSHPSWTLVATVQVGCVTTIIPPTAFKPLGTIVAPVVVVGVRRGESLSTVPCEGVPYSALVLTELDLVFLCLPATEKMPYSA